MKIRNADLDDLPDFSQKDWFHQVEKLKYDPTPVKPKRITQESPISPPPTLSPAFRSRRLSSRSIREEAGINGKNGEPTVAVD